MASARCGDTFALVHPSIRGDPFCSCSLVGDGGILINQNPLVPGHFSEMLHEQLEPLLPVFLYEVELRRLPDHPSVHPGVSNPGAASAGAPSVRVPAGWGAQAAGDSHQTAETIHRGARWVAIPARSLLVKDSRIRFLILTRKPWGWIRTFQKNGVSSKSHRSSTSTSGSLPCFCWYLSRTDGHG